MDHLFHYEMKNSFCEAPKAKKLFGRFLVFFLAAEQMRQVLQHFAVLDAKGDGVLDKQESENCRRCYRDGVVPFSLNFLAGGRCPPDPPVFGWGGKAPPDPPPKRSYLAFDRGGQTGPPRSNDFFFGAADDTRIARTSGWTPADDTGATDDRPTSDDTGPGIIFSDP